MKTQPRALRGVLAGVCAFTMLGLAGPAVFAGEDWEKGGEGESGGKGGEGCG